MLTLRAKLAHVHRRFGLGACPKELALGEQIGFDAALHRLLDYRTVNEKFSVHPYEFVWRVNRDADPSAASFRLWWVMRMLSGQRPAQEQLTLFWHSHFAVSDSKIEDGSMMLQYLNTLRDHADGKFVDLLKAVSKDPAMMKYLDLQRSLVGSPNENFAREVMELFTLGIGHYSERDVKEAARAFTGWSYVNMFYESPGPNVNRLKAAMTYNRALSAYAFMPAMHDKGPKTILGKTDFFDGDSFLEMLAMHPATIHNICTKLWSYYAYSNPEPAIIDALATEWIKSGGEIKHVLFTIARRPEFYSEKCVRKKVKSPVDLCIAICRQMGVGEELLTMRGSADIETPMNGQVTGNLRSVADRMSKAGLSLFYPTDVSGWKGGAAWVSPAQMVERYGFRGLLVYAPKSMGAGARNVLTYVKSLNPQTSVDVVDGISGLFDIDLSTESKSALTQLLDRQGAMKVLDKEGVWAATLDRILFTLMAAP